MRFSSSGSGRVATSARYLKRSPPTVTSRRRQSIASGLDRVCTRSAATRVSSARVNVSMPPDVG